MELKIKQMKEITINGSVFIETVYESGHVVRQMKGEPIESAEISDPFDNETAMLELLSMTEYNTCLLEMANM